jgi:hypothetical protein
VPGGTLKQFSPSGFSPFSPTSIAMFSLDASATAQRKMVSLVPETEQSEKAATLLSSGFCVTPKAYLIAGQV